MRVDPTSPPEHHEPEHAEPAGTSVLHSDLVDLSGVSLHGLERLPPTALKKSLLRILAESERQPNSYNQNYHANI